MILDAVHSGGERRPDDFYPTPREATDALLDSGIVGHLKKVWEPACGDGAISRVLEARRVTVVSTDLIYRGYGEGGVDFLETNHLFAPAIVTNPPFKLAEQFIRHGLLLGAETMAMLLRVNFWSAARRLPLFEEFQPAVVAPFTWRLDFTGAGAPHTDCMWVVWGAGWAPCTTHFRPLAKPAPRPAATADWPEDMLAWL